MTDPTSNTPYDSGTTPATGGQAPGTQGSGGTGYTGDTAYPDTPVASTGRDDTYRGSSTGYGDTSSSTKDVAKDEAGNVKDQAVDSGKQVAQTAKDEAAGVAREAKYQARQVFDTGLDQVKTQAGTQQQRAAEGVRGIAQELTSMSQNSEGSGLASKLAGDLGRQAEEVAGWLQNREPADILNEVQRFARRRPGMFLGICAGAGLLLGRVARGLQADHADDGYDQRGFSGGYERRTYVQDDRYARAYDNPYASQSRTTGTYAGSGTAVGDSYEADRAAGNAPEYQAGDADTGLGGQGFGDQGYRNQGQAGTTWTNEGGERR